MSDERDGDGNDRPGEQLKQGLGLLWRAARGAAAGARKNMNRTELGRSFQDAGRELARAATNVVGRLSDEIGKNTRPRGHGDEAPYEPPPREESRQEDVDDEFDGVKAPVKKPTGPTPQDPGFRIMVDDDDKKPR